MGGCLTCPPSPQIVGEFFTYPPTPAAPAFTAIVLTPEELAAIARMPMCAHGRRVGLHPCPWCSGING